MKNSALQVVLQYFHKLTSNINLDAFTKRHVYPSTNSDPLPDDIIFDDFTKRPMFKPTNQTTLPKNINLDDINFDDLTGGESMFKNHSITTLPKNVNLDGITKTPPMFEMFDEIKTK